MMGVTRGGGVEVGERFAQKFVYNNPADAVGKTLEFLAPPTEKKSEKKKRETTDEEAPNFFGIPLDDQGLDESDSASIESHAFRIAGVLNTEIKERAGQSGLRGLLPGA